MKSKKSKLIIQCHKCKKRVDCTNGGLVLGFVLKDNRQINVCYDCISELGELTEKGADTEEFYRALGI